MTTASLNAQYREDGWGLITDKVWDGRIDPVNVESSARAVARWAYAQEVKHVEIFNNQSQQLFEQDQQITRLNEELGKLRKELVACQAPQNG